MAGGRASGPGAGGRGQRRRRRGGVRSGRRRARPDAGLAAGGAQLSPLPAPASLWLDTLPAGDLERRRPALPGPAQVDVAIVGGGYTGLWTAYYLARRDPGLRIVVLEREFAGFGASGRNGGWLSNLLPLSWEAIAAESSREGAVAWQRAADATVDEVLAVARAEGIDAQAATGGYLCVATSEVQARRLKVSVARAREWGFGPDDLDWLSRAEARARVAADRVFGA